MYVFIYYIVFHKTNKTDNYVQIFISNFVFIKQEWNLNKQTSEINELVRAYVRMYVRSAYVIDYCIIMFLESGYLLRKNRGNSYILN